MFPINEPLPPGLADAAVTVTSVEPLTGVLTLQTAGGKYHVLLDRFGAAQLATALVDFLSVAPDDPRLHATPPN